MGCAFRSVVGGYERFGRVGLMEDFVIQGCGPIGLYSTVVARERRPHHHCGRSSTKPAGPRSALGRRSRDQH